LLYRCRPFRPQVWRFSKVSRYSRMVSTAPSYWGVVHRVGLWHPHLHAVDDLGGVEEADGGPVPPWRARTASVSDISQMSSPSKQKYSTPRQAIPGWTMSWLHAPKFCYPARPRPGIVDVDPVVREGLLFGRHQRDEAEVTVAELVGGCEKTSSGGGGSRLLIRSVRGEGRDHVCRRRARRRFRYASR